MDEVELITGLRRCGRCNELKLIGEFFGEGNRSSICKSCKRDTGREYDIRNRESRRKQAKARQSIDYVKAQKEPVTTAEGRLCTKCKRRLPDDMFVRHLGCAGGLTRRCKDCARQQHYEWRQRNHDHWRAYNNRKSRERYERDPARRRAAKDANFRKKYGISLEEAEAILLAQNGKCAICAMSLGPMGSITGNGKPCLDHCHATGKIRGFLCNGCNSALGMMNDNPISLESAAAYIRRHW